MTTNKKADIAQAILAINPAAQFSYNSNDYSTMIWNDATTPISKEDIDAKIIELDAQYQTAEDTEVADKASGNQKLLDLGLTQAEVDAITK